MSTTVQVRVQKKHDALIGDVLLEQNCSLSDACIPEERQEILLEVGKRLQAYYKSKLMKLESMKYLTKAEESKLKEASIAYRLATKQFISVVKCKPIWSYGLDI